MDESRQKALEELLGSLKDEPAFATLEDRAQDAGHLEEEDYGHLLDEKFEAAKRDNLRRHVLFCETCSDELLRRAGTDPDAAPTPAASTTPSRRPNLLMWAIVLVVLLGGCWFAWDRFIKTDPPGIRIADTFVFDEVRVGLGAKIGGAAKAKPKRLFLKLVPAPTEPQWLYAFILSDNEFVPFHPDPDSNIENPVDSSLFPPKGWPDIDVLSPRWFIGILTPKPVATLEDESFRSTLSLELDQLREDGGDPGSIIAGLRSVAGLEDAAIFWVGIEE